VSKKKQLPVLKEKNEDEEEEEEEEESNEQDENNNDKDDDEEEDSCDSDSDDSDKEGEDGEVLRYSRKRDRDDRLDCESIISTYSNIYNHPAMIGNEESKIKLSKKTGLPLGVLQEKEKSKREIERIEHNIVRVLPDLPLKRDKNESKDEKKERKQAIKAHRRERRVEKKINKTAFKEEKKSQIAQITSTNNNKSVVKLPL
jgi:protein LTV1